MKRKKSSVNFVFPLFLVIAVVLLTVGAVILNSAIRFRKNAVETRAVITDIQTHRSGDDTHHSVWVEYEYDGKVYKDVRLNEYNSGMYTGKKITILVDPKNPQKASTEYGLIFAGGVLILMGVIFSCVGIIPIIVRMKRASLQKQLIAGGCSIFARVESITLNTAYTLNGRNPYVVYCTYQDEYKGVVYRFKSGNIWQNPEYFLQPGSDIRVYVNAGDYSKYYVDVESMIENKVIDYT